MFRYIVCILVLLSFVGCQSVKSLEDTKTQIEEAGDALGEATVWIGNGEIFSGRGLSTDVIEASAKAYVSAINKMLATKGHPADQIVGGE